MAFDLNVNGARHVVDADPETPLLWVIRDHVGFQLPALLLPGTMLVVSPLISPMKDQVDVLNRRGIPAAAIHGQVAATARQQAVAAARRGALRLL